MTIIVGLSNFQTSKSKWSNFNLPNNQGFYTNCKQIKGFFFHKCLAKFIVIGRKKKEGKKKTLVGNWINQQLWSLFWAWTKYICEPVIGNLKLTHSYCNRIDSFRLKHGISCLSDQNLSSKKNQNCKNQTAALFTIHIIIILYYA